MGSLPYGDPSNSKFFSGVPVQDIEKLFRRKIDYRAKRGKSCLVKGGTHSGEL